MTVTISTHNGSKVSRDHNIRNRKVTDGQKHIDPGGRYEVWRDEKPWQAYRRIFGEEFDAWNAGQRKSRKFRSYYGKICADNKKKPVYEMIVNVHCPDKDQKMGMELSRQILKDFVDGWEERNPQLELVGAYFHADEVGKEPHVHIDYIPVAECSRGMAKQNSLDRAYRQMGFETKSIKQTAQIAWEHRENEVLEGLCNGWELDVIHPQRGKGVKHLETEKYKMQKKLEELERELDAVESAKRVALEELESVRSAKRAVLEELGLDRLEGIRDELRRQKEFRKELRRLPDSQDKHERYAASRRITAALEEMEDEWER